MDEELLLLDDERKWFPEMDSSPGEDAVKMVEMTMHEPGHPKSLMEKNNKNNVFLPANVASIL